mmetsp:Transcript_7634/g.12003  ORF Transcript_7634/g.12003 Transcript_7634/m.12003 type:complete len:291 (+) Transcript_7634:661-1533(+)
MDTTATVGRSEPLTSNAAAKERCAAGSTYTNLKGLSALSAATSRTTASSLSLLASPSSWLTNATTHSPALPHAASNSSGVPASSTGAASFFGGLSCCPRSLPSTWICTCCSHWCICEYTRVGAGYAAAEYCTSLLIASPSLGGTTYSRRIAGVVVTWKRDKLALSLAEMTANAKSSWKLAASATYSRGASPSKKSTTLGFIGFCCKKLSTSLALRGMTKSGTFSKIHSPSASETISPAYTSGSASALFSAPWGKSTTSMHLASSASSPGAYCAVSSAAAASLAFTSPICT